MSKVHRLAANRIVRLLSRKMGKEIQSKKYQNKSRRSLKDWVFRLSEEKNMSHLAPGSRTEPEPSFINRFHAIFVEP